MKIIILFQIFALLFPLNIYANPTAQDDSPAAVVEGYYEAMVQTYQDEELDRLSDYLDETSVQCQNIITAMKRILFTRRYAKDHYGQDIDNSQLPYQLEIGEVVCEDDNHCRVTAEMILDEAKAYPPFLCAGSEEFQLKNIDGTWKIESHKYAGFDLFETSATVIREYDENVLEELMKKTYGNTIQSPDVTVSPENNEAPAAETNMESIAYSSAIDYLSDAVEGTSICVPVSEAHPDELYKCLKEHGYVPYAEPISCDIRGQAVRSDWLSENGGGRLTALIDAGAENKVTLERAENSAYPFSKDCLGTFEGFDFSLGSSLSSVKQKLSGFSATYFCGDEGTPAAYQIITMPVDSEDIAYLQLEFESVLFLHSYAFPYGLNFSLPAEFCLTGVTWYLSDSFQASDLAAWEELSSYLEENWGKLGEGVQQMNGTALKYQGTSMPFSESVKESEGFIELEEKLSDTRWFPAIIAWAEEIRLSERDDGGFKITLQGKNEVMIHILMGQL